MAERHQPRVRCWRVWFKDGTAVLVDAETASEAEKVALRITDQEWWLQRDPSTWPTDKVECLSD